MFLTRKRTIRILLVGLLFLAPYMIKAMYVPTARDTGLNPESWTQVPFSSEEDPLHSEGYLDYYYNEMTDVITVVDIRNGYAWKTGVDKMPALEVADQCNIIKNDYEDQLSDLDFSSFGNWSYETGDTRSTVKVDGVFEIAKVSLSGLDNTHAADEISLSYGGLNLENGKDYRFSFMTRSSKDKSANVRVGTIDAGVFTEISSTLVTLLDNDDNSFGEYTFDFSMTAASITDAVIIIELGYIDGLEENTGIISFDDFKLEETETAVVVVDTDQILQGSFTIYDENLTIKEQDVKDVCVNKEIGLNEQFFMPWANSLLTIEYFKEFLSGGTGLGISRASSTSKYQIVTNSTLYSANDGDASHFIFEAYFKMRDETIPPVCGTGFIAVNNECKGIDFFYEGAACPEGEEPVDGECALIDPVCEVGMKPVDGECVDPDKDDIVELTIYLHVYMEETGLRFVLINDEMTGNGIKGLSTVSIAPFMGATGGKEQVFDFENLSYGDTQDKFLIPGYSFVPDGSGSLIRYKDQTAELDSYVGEVYGQNFTQADNYELYERFYVPLKTASIPVYGMVHGDNQNAFFAYATSGDEYMKIISTPDEGIDNLYYNFTYAKFEFNKKFEQVYSTTCQTCGYFDIYEEINDFDIELNFNFLQGDGSVDGYSADYVGMAMLYRDILIGNGELTPLVTDNTEIPIRIDFLMADSENAVFGYKNAVATDVKGVRSILDQILELGITNINSGLLGWNDGGITLGDPSDTDFTGQIGRKGQFEDLVKDFKKEGVDISFMQNYFKINEEQITLRRNAAKHTNNWYSRRMENDFLIYEYYFARPVRSIKWINEQTDTFDDLGVNSYSISGISNNLISDYTDNDNRIDSLNIITNGFSKLDSDVLLNLEQPNGYLWQYTDRYLNMNVFSSQYLIESDTVPFLQLVLQNTMELYGPYSNFSFYTDSDVLRMIDYNVYPSFVLTDEPAHVLADSNSNVFYSTEYKLYADPIASIYSRVNEALSPVIGAEWIDREVVENGVIVNMYDNGVSIVINYTDETINYNGNDIEPVSFKVIGG